MLFKHDENSTICWNIRGTSRYRGYVLHAKHILGENPRVMPHIVCGWRTISREEPKPERGVQWYTKLNSRNPLASIRNHSMQAGMKMRDIKPHLLLKEKKRKVNVFSFFFSWRSTLKGSPQRLHVEPKSKGVKTGERIRACPPFFFWWWYSPICMATCRTRQKWPRPQ